MFARKIKAVFDRNFKALFVMQSSPGAFAGGRRLTIFHTSFGVT
jgi:hypothetical protein